MVIGKSTHFSMVLRALGPRDLNNDATPFTAGDRPTMLALGAETASVCVSTMERSPLVEISPTALGGQSGHSQ
jgi:hypothetical protein